MRPLHPLGLCMRRSAEDQQSGNRCQTPHRRPQDVETPGRGRAPGAPRENLLLQSRYLPGLLGRDTRNKTRKWARSPTRTDWREEGHVTLCYPANLAASVRAP